MGRRREVVAKRGCSCCGTGCVIMATLIPLSIFGMWEIIGVSSLLVWPAALTAGNGVRFARARLASGNE